MAGAAGGLIGACHCGAVSIALPAPPAYMNRCNCTLCTKSGGVWGYYDPADVVISGDPCDSYVRADLDQACLATDRCATCGCVVGWHALVPLDPPRMGINMNLFEPEAVAGIEIRAVDGRAW